MMTDQERLIEIGTSWYWGAMEKGQCIVSNSISDDFNVKIGDSLMINFFTPETFSAIAEHYNTLVPKHDRY